MKFPEFEQVIRTEYEKRFPFSRVSVEPFICFGNSVDIRCYFSADRKECPNGLIDNDMFRIRFTVDLPKSFDFKQSEMPEKSVMYCNANVYMASPEDSRKWCDYRKIPYRTTAGTEKIIKSFGRFCDKLKQAVSDDMTAGRIHQNFTEMVKVKIA